MILILQFLGLLIFLSLSKPPSPRRSLRRFSHVYSPQLQRLSIRTVSASLIAPTIFNRVACVFFCRSRNPNPKDINEKMDT